MKKVNRIVISAILVFVMCIGQLVTIENISSQSAYANDDKYGYLFNTPEENAYIMTGSEIESSYCTMIASDDNDDLRYATLTSEEGIESLYFAGAHYLDLKLEESFYNKEDHEFIFSIVYYDYGPGRGTFYFKYYNENGIMQTVSLIKPGKNPGWAVNTVVVDDIDLTKTFEDGAHIRVECSSGGKNAFKKVEAVNISKAKREGKKVNISCVGTTLDQNFKELGFIKADDVSYKKENISMPCTQYDVQRLLLAFEGKDTSNLSVGLKTQTLTQGQLVKYFMDAVGLSSGENIIESGNTAGLLSLSDLILYADSTATVYNLLNLAYSALYYKLPDGSSLISKLISKGHFGQDMITSITDAKFTEIYYATPQRLPYTRIIDQETGRTYYYVNFFGKEMRRTYMTLQCWSEDGKGMIVGQSSAKVLNLFYYNIDEQMLYFIDTDVVNYGEGVDAIIGTDNNVYYVKNVGKKKEIRRANLIDFKSEKLFDIPEGIEIGGFSLSNDCRYLAFEYEEPYTPDKNYPQGSELGARLDILTGEWNIFHHNWEIQNNMMHVQVNPVNPDLLFFCHDSAEPKIGIIDDRMWTIDLSTGEKKNVFPQGMALGACLTVPTHETWTTDGQWLSFVLNSNYNKGALYMVGKDGRHIRKFENPYGYFFKHCYASGDGKYLTSDGHYMTVINTQTEQYFKISRWKEDGNGGQVNHPYHPHPIVARNHYKVSWGMVYKDVLGVAWYDFTEIDENEIAKGGHYAINETVDRISYESLECETKEVKKSGKDCLYVKRGKSLYLDINPDVVDSINGAVTISFDYLDSSYNPIVLTYTRGIEKENDYSYIDNGEISVRRGRSGSWKHAEISIESGNFENPGKYASDIKISGVTADLYITNIKVEAQQKK